MGEFIPLSDTEFRYSHLVSDEEVQENGAFTLLPVRRNLAHESVHRVVLDIGKRWTEVVGDGTSDGFSGIENTISGAWDALILPEGQQERLEFTSWFTQFFFLIDDKAETLPRDIAHGKLNAELAEILGDGGKAEPKTALARMLVPQIRKLLAHDYDRGLPFLEAWRQWALLSEARDVADVKDIDDYFELRTIHCGILGYSSAIEYTMELNLTHDERESAEPLRHLVAGRIGFSNDWWTWPKERAAMVAGKCRLTNAVTVLMKQYNVTTHKALSMLKKMILDQERKIIDMRNELLSAGNVSQDLQLYVDAHLWMVGGNALWESTCPRYHKQFDFTL